MKAILNILCIWIPFPKLRRGARNKLANGVCFINDMFLSKRKYAKWIRDVKQDKSLFVPITQIPFERKSTDVKIFAYYLTQFHAIPENDLAHGKGFTEWTNVASVVPQFSGHWQPHVPYDVGFYNLLDINVMRRQAELAKMYGIYGWCFYYYWFSGRRVLEKPLENFLKSDIDMHFHFCWANENWSKLWDGGNQEIILEQKYADDDAENFFHDILPYIKDSRYEKIDNKPVLIIYNIKKIPRKYLHQFKEKLDEMAIQNGFAGFFWGANPVNNFFDIKSVNFDVVVEFPPHALMGLKNKMRSRLQNGARFTIKNVHRYIQNKAYFKNNDVHTFKACFPYWDNTARKLYSNAVIFDMYGDDFYQWLTDIVKWTKKNNPDNQQYVYINAWNEWAEGAHLEPDTRHGYKNLGIVKRCLEEARKSN